MFVWIDFDIVAQIEYVIKKNKEKQKIIENKLKDTYHLYFTHIQKYNIYIY